MKPQLINFYLEFINHDESIDQFAEQKGLTNKETIRLLNMGRKYNDQ